MQNGEGTPTAAENTKKAVPDEVTKHSFRLKVWRHLESNGLVFPRPVYNRIPNFKGANEATAKLTELDVFKNAKSIKVNPDKPQEPIRVICLEQKKTLYVPVPRLQKGFLNRLELPEGESGPAAIRKAVSRNGMENFGQPIGIEDTVSLDLVVMGSVAVSKEGFRIGKGRGYGDLEFGLIMHMKAIRPETIVVTTVHDCQVFDTLPAELFGPHDVPIDIIVTPTQVIQTKRMSERPVGILWHLLSNRRIELMPILGQLREIEMLDDESSAKKEKKHKKSKKEESGSESEEDVRIQTGKSGEGDDETPFKEVNRSERYKKSKSKKRKTSKGKKSEGSSEEDRKPSGKDGAITYESSEDEKVNNPDNE